MRRYLPENTHSTGHYYYLVIIRKPSEPFRPLTLIYQAHFEDVPCQSGVNHIFEG